jgi:endonuclease YncB( thermonuclease family)
VNELAKNKNVGLGCSLFLGLLIIYLIYELLKWTVFNILGVLGIIFVAAGFYFTFTRKKYKLTLYWPVFAIVIGFFLTLFWFSFKEPLNTLAILFLCSFVYLLITTIVMLILKNVMWKKYSGITASLLVLFIIFISIAPKIENNSQQIETVKSEKIAKNQKEKNKESSTDNENKKEDDSKDTPVVAPVNNNEEKRIEQKEEQEKLKAAKKQQEDLAKKFNLEAVTVARVVDGDTLELTDGRKVRLIGVNTPETTTRTEQYGKEASKYTTSKLEGKKIYLQKDVSETDQYGRLLRIVWIQIPTDEMNESEIRKKMFNADLVLNGYAEPFTYPPDVKYSDYFVKFAREAREKNRGLWAFGEYGTTKGDLDPKQVSNSTSSSSSSAKNSTSSSNSKSNSSNTNYSNKPKSSEGIEWFKNCTELRKKYPNGVPSDHPAYQPKLDRDKDNFACER